MIESDPGLKYRLQELFNNLRQGSLRLGRLTARKVHARDVQVDNSILVDTIDENTSAAGVTIDSVLLKDGVIAIGDVAFDDATSDPLIDGAAAADGTENSVARKDHVHPKHHAAVTVGDTLHTLSTQEISGVAAGAAQVGHVELATTAEVTTGTDTGRAVTPAGLPSQIQDNKWVYWADSGAADAYVITPAPVIAAYAAGQVFHFKATNANTGASTLNVNAKGAVAITKNYNTALVANDIKANQIVTVVYDGVAAAFQMQSQLGNATTTAAEAIAAVEGEATLDLTGDVTIAAAKSMAVDTISEKTGAAGVTVDGILLKDDYIEVDEIAAPGAGAANTLRLYAKDVGGVTALCFVDAAGVENTLLARTRYQPFHVAHGQVGSRFADAATNDFAGGFMVPTDWVPGTDIILHAAFFFPDTGAAAMYSRIHVAAPDEVSAVYNYENTGQLLSNGTNDAIKDMARTVAAASITAGDVIWWQFRRQGGDAQDTVSNYITVQAVFIEYTAYF